MTSTSPLPSLDQLDGCFEYRLTLLVAPAESGKTQRLKEWVATHLHPNGLPAAWLDLAAIDNLSETFIADLHTALVLGSLLRTENLSSTGAIAFNLTNRITDLLNALTETPQTGVIIFDHYQAVHSPVIHDGVQYLIDYLPEPIHLVIASRSEPPLNLARYRVRRQMKAYGL
jgi:LuxR family transcriptional regulator, maltose regulon positive regulatory protein